jgi:hypothetical protein
MKTTGIRYFLTIAAPLLMLAIGACSKLCNSGYEGSRCNVLTTAKFEGQWGAVDTPGNIIYLDTIAQGAALGGITLSASFAGHHFSHTINASVSEDVLTIPYQQPDSANNFVQGTGTISADHNHISLNYQLISGPDSARVTSSYGGTWTRQ